MQERVLVTGLGIITAIGNGIRENLHALLSLRSGIAPLARIGSRLSPIPVAEIPLSNDQLAEMAGTEDAAGPFSRNALLALVAARQILDESGSFRRRPADRRTALIMATTVGGMDLNELYYKSLLSSPEHKAYIQVFDSADCTEKVASFLKIRHLTTTISTACSSSANAIMMGARLIASRRFDRVVVGGCAALTRFTLNGFNALEILSPTGCMPFDKNRNGLTIGEGAAMLVLEAESQADPAYCFCEVSGYANANEAFHATASSSDGSGAILAMRGALAAAKLHAESISYINAHGTGTEINDLSEGRAIEFVFGTNLPEVSSTKGFTGHTLGAAGAVEGVFSALALANQVVLPAVRFSEAMPELTFAPVTHVASKPLKHVMSNSFGFGGNNTSLIFSRC